MKNKRFLLLGVVCLIVAFLSAPVSGFAKASAAEENAQPDEKMVAATRFLNILNHNNAYDEDFLSEESLVNAAVISQLHLRDSEFEDYISEKYIADFVYNMYGVEVVDFSEINSEFLSKEGFVYIIPRGYETYSHEFVSLCENEDGTIAVNTRVTVAYHDANPETFDAVSLFVKNDNSLYGYNLVYSNVLTNSQKA